MKIEKTSIPGAHILLPEVHADERGEFWRSYCRQELAENGLEFDVCQSNVSVNPHQANSGSVNTTAGTSSGPTSP